jgi:pantoate--beta-alanine ligase
METISSLEDMRRISHARKAEGRTIGFVPTMGYLHEGHLSLVRAARREAETTIVSIFVNPTQFGTGEDLDAYPRDLERDSSLLVKEGVDFLFFPRAEDMYPPGYKTYVEVHELQDRLCGRSRPGHFRGVCTVVLKLFEIISPDIAYFGQKDAQQVVIIRKMVKDFNLGVRVETLPTIREADGLALSSRNNYLSPAEREAGLVLSRSLIAAQKMISGGERRSSRIQKRMRQVIEREPLARIDYIEIVDGEELGSVESVGEGTLIALAVFIGKTRLIDNLIVRS